MMKYVATAAALKFFSCCAPTRHLYRQLGNQFGGRRRSSDKMPAYYLDRIKRMLRLNREHGFVHDGDRILELGTGWLHWEAITLRLFYDVHGVLYDVWDNRQLNGLKNYFRQLGPLLTADQGFSAAEMQRARSLIEFILRVDSFDQLYQRLGFEYVIASDGSVSQFPNQSFQLVVSAGVLEHVNRAALPTLAAETRRILRPGGWVIHSIDTSDHLAHYDTSVSKKRYLGFSEAKWKWLCENEVQYINRMQRGEWLDLFHAQGFVVKEEECHRVDISSLRPVGRFASMPREDLACTVVRLAMQHGPPAS